MHGSIRRRGEHSWEITIDLGRDENGKRKRTFITVRGTKAEAQRRLREMLIALDKGLTVDTNNKLTVADFLQGWLQDQVRPNTRPKTASIYETAVRCYITPVLGSIPLTKLQPTDIQHLFAALHKAGRSARTIQLAYRVLHTALGRAIKWGLLWRNPCQAVDPPQWQRPEIRVPQPSQVAHLLELARQTPYYAVLHFLAYTGCRRGEALGLKWEDIDLERGIVSVVRTLQRVSGAGLIFQPPKSAKGKRLIYLDSDTIAVLREHEGSQLLRKMELGPAYEDNHLVFPGPLGRPLDPSVLTHTFERLTRQAGFKGIRLHDLRHFHATLLLREGVHPKVVQERLGHSTIVLTLDTYSHVVPGLQERAAQTFAEALKREARWKGG